MAEHIFTGFGFGPIQGGLFVKEAFGSGNFARIVVAEIDQALVEAVRANKGSFYVNVAGSDGIDVLRIDGVELLNPGVANDRDVIVSAIAESTEIATCLPSVDFYEAGGTSSVASLIAEGLSGSTAKGTIVYTAENNNHAAEILQQRVMEKAGSLQSQQVQFLNTVIAKISRVVTDAAEISELQLAPIVPGFGRAFLVEKFDRILVSRAKIAGFKPGIEKFFEKDNLLAFEETKFNGHNAIHALLAYLGALKGYAKMTELKGDSAIMETARGALIDECGAALIKKHGHIGDELFTKAGYKEYAKDLLERTTNPYLADTVERAGRDLLRKLGADDRIFGTMQLVLECGIEPTNMALGAMAGIAVLLGRAEENGLPVELRFGDWRQVGEVEIEKILNWIWKAAAAKTDKRLVKCVVDAKERMEALLIAK